MKFKSELLFEMSNIRAKYIKIEDLDFSFYFSSKQSVDSRHGIRVKICWNREKIGKDLIDGILYLHGDYKYEETSHPNYKPDSVDLATARYFFKKYKVLFSAIWEGVLDENVMVDYLKGNITFKELLAEFELPGDKYILVEKCKDKKELESIVRKFSIFNIND